MEALHPYLPLWRNSKASIADETQTRKSICPLVQTDRSGLTRSVEDYRPGYPRFTALLSAHEPYFLCRRFSKLRARLLLLKQDRLSMLEQRLERVDHEEISPLFLGRSRGDGNMERISVLSDIESRLADYGKCRS